MEFCLCCSQLWQMTFPPSVHFAKKCTEWEWVLLRLIDHHNIMMLQCFAAKVEPGLARWSDDRACLQEPFLFLHLYTFANVNVNTLSGRSTATHVCEFSVTVSVPVTLDSTQHTPSTVFMGTISSVESSSKGHCCSSAVLFLKCHFPKLWAAQT